MNIAWPKKRVAFVISSVCALLLPLFGLSAVMQSTNYKIQSDSVNFAGGLSTSTNYSLEDTVGEVATGNSTSTNYRMSAGYQASVNSSIAISSPSDVSLTSIGGVTGGESTGSMLWTVTTSNPTGYTLLVNSDTDPALKSGAYSIANYSAATADPDFTFSVDATSAEFGFTPEGLDVVSRFRDNGVACNTGSLDTTDSCYDDFEITPKLVAATSSSNYPTGTGTTIKPRVKIGSSVIQKSGTYTATITATAIAF